MQENLTALVESAGIVGAGGAGFPTHVKLNAKADTVIINGAECEPLLRVDQQLMARQAGRLLAALDKIVAHLGAREGVVALKEHYPDLYQRAIAMEDKAMPHLTSVKGLGRSYAWRERFGAADGGTGPC